MNRRGGGIIRAAQRGASFVEAMLLVALAIGAIVVAAKILGGQQKETSEVLGQHIQTLDNKSRDSNSTGTAASPGDTYAVTNATCDSTHGCDGATPPTTPPAGASSAPPSDPAPPPSSPGVLDYAGSFAKGFFVDGAWGTVVGIATAVRHPVDTATGLYSAASHPVDTYNAVKGELADAWAKDPSRVIGGGIFQALTIVGPGAAAKIGTVAKVGEVTAEASAANKLAEASTLARTTKAAEVTSSATTKAGEVCEGGVCTTLGNCFAAGTPVLTPDGERPIEEVAVGDVVLARDPETGETKAEHVVQLFVTPDRELVDLAIEAGGALEHVKVTGEHPFFTQDRGFVPVSALVVGEHLQTALGEGTVVSLASLPERATVFNFEVEEAHTYFVGHVAAWVHNQCTKPLVYVASDVRNGGKHAPRQIGDIGALPTNPESMLQKSVQIKPTSTVRIAVDPAAKEIVIFPETFKDSNIFHGYVRRFEDLAPEQSALVKKMGWVNKKGKIIATP